MKRFLFYFSTLLLTTSALILSLTANYTSLDPAPQLVSRPQQNVALLETTPQEKKQNT